MGPITLIGFMGSGKTTVARYLAERLQLECIDLDREIEKAAGTKIRDIFSRHGENFFRELEFKVLSELSSGKYVLSIGGGAVMFKNNMKELLEKKPLIVYLKTSPEVIKERLASSYKSRPLLAGAENVEEFIARTLEKREPVYEKVANITIKTDNLTINQVVDKIIEQIKQRGELQ